MVEGATVKGIYFGNILFRFSFGYRWGYFGASEFQEEMQAEVSQSSSHDVIMHMENCN